MFLVEFKQLLAPVLIGVMLCKIEIADKFFTIFIAEYFSQTGVGDQYSTAIPVGAANTSCRIFKQLTIEVVVRRIVDGGGRHCDLADIESFICSVSRNPRRQHLNAADNGRISGL